MGADTELTAGVERLRKIEWELAALYDEHGDDADQRPNYRQLENERLALLELLATQDAVTPAGMIAKAKALLRENVRVDYRWHHRNWGVACARRA